MTNNINSKIDSKAIRKESIDKAKLEARKDMEKRTNMYVNKNHDLTESNKCSKIHQLNTKLSDSNKDLNDNYHKLDKIHSQLKQEKEILKKEYDTFKQEINPKLAVFEVKSKQCDRNIEHIESKLKTKAQLVEELTKKIYQIEKELASANQSVASHKDKVQLLDTEHNTKLKRFQDNNMNLMSENRKLTEELLKTKEQIKVGEGKYTEITEDKSKLLSEISTLNEKIKKDEAQYSKSQKELAALKSDIEVAVAEKNSNNAKKDTEMVVFREKFEKQISELSQENTVQKEKNRDLIAKSKALDEAYQKCNGDIKKDTLEYTNNLKKKDNELHNIVGELSNLKITNDELSSYKTENEAKKVELSKYIKSLEDLRDKGTKCNEELYEKMNQESNITRKLNLLQSGKDELAEKNKVLTTENIKLSSENKQVLLQSKNTNETTERLKLEIENLSKTLTANEATISGLNDKLREELNQKSILSNKNLVQEDTVNQLNTDISGFTAKIDQLQKELSANESKINLISNQARQQQNKQQHEIEELKKSSLHKQTQQQTAIKQLVEDSEKKQNQQTLEIQKIKAQSQEALRLKQSQIDSLQQTNSQDTKKLKSLESKIINNELLEAKKNDPNIEIIVKHNHLNNTQLEYNEFDNNIDPIQLGNLIFIKNLNIDNNEIKPFKYVVILDNNNPNKIIIKALYWSWTHQRFMIDENIEEVKKQDLINAYNQGLNSISWTWCKVNGRIPGSCRDIIDFSPHTKKWLEYSVNSFYNHDMELLLKGKIYKVKVPELGKNTGTILEIDDHSDKLKYSITRSINFIDPVTKTQTTMGQRLPNFISILEEALSNQSMIHKDYIENVFRKYNLDLPDIDEDPLSELILG